MIVLPLLLLLPAAVAAAIAVARGRRTLQGTLAVAGLLATLAVALWATATGPTVSWRWSSSIHLGLAVDGFSAVMVILIPAIAAPVAAYAAVTEDDGRGRLLALLLAFVACMLLLVTAADFLSLLIGWELVGATSWALIGHRWRIPANAGAAAHAFITTRTGDLGLYLAAGLTFAATGSFAFDLLGQVSRPALDAVAAGVLLAAAAKSAQVPFTPWLFKAMAGPTPVSALLHSATLVAAGAYALIRLGPAFDSVTWFRPAVLAIGLTTALAGGIVALLQSDAKRLLAGSTSAQYGLMFIAVGAGSTAAAGAHLVAHAAFKSLLFLLAGVAVGAVGTGRLGAMRLGRRLPRYAIASAVGALALAAVPPLGAAWTKERVLTAAAHDSLWLAAGVLAASLLSALYAARFHLLAYGRRTRPAGAPDPRPHPQGRVELVAVASLAAITLALSVFWLPAAAPVVEAATGGTLFETAPWELVASMAVIGAAFTAAWQLDRRGQLTAEGLPERLQAGAEGWLWLSQGTQGLVVRPTVGLSRALAALDDQVVDGGVRAVGSGVRLLSVAAWRALERAVDAAVRAVATAVDAVAVASRLSDDRGVDGAVEATARGVGLAGTHSRRLQTGMTHHYYVIAAAGVLIAIIVLTALR